MAEGWRCVIWIAIVIIDMYIVLKQDWDSYK